MTTTCECSKNRGELMDIGTACGWIPCDAESGNGGGAARRVDAVVDAARRGIVSGVNEFAGEIGDVEPGVVGVRISRS